MVRDILIPATVPEILGGIRIALAGAWGLEAIAELLGSQTGIGKVSRSWPAPRTRKGSSATLLLLGIVAIMADAIAGALVGHPSPSLEHRPRDERPEP